MKAELSGKVWRKRMRRRLNLGRTSLPVMVSVTLVNQLLLAMGVNYHFLFSAAMPYYINWTVRELDLRGAVPVLSAVLSVGLCSVFLTCWMLSRRRRGWLRAALGLYTLDTLALLVFAVTVLRNPAACLLEALTHAVLLALLAYAVAAEEQLRRKPQRRSVPTETGTFSKPK